MLKVILLLELGALAPSLSRFYYLKFGPSAQIKGNLAVTLGAKGP